MSPRGKGRTTVAKMQREMKVQEAKLAKEARKRDRREAVDRAREEGRSPWETDDDELDTSLDREPPAVS